MDEKQYAIKCGVCGTEFYILDEKRPNCQAEGQVFNYLSKNKNIKGLKLFAAAIYSIHGFLLFTILLCGNFGFILCIVIIYLLLRCCWIVLFFTPLLVTIKFVAINTGWYFVTSELLPSIDIEYFNIVISWLSIKTGIENY